LLKRPNWREGRTVTLEHTSAVLADNPLGDPATRQVTVWLPPQYDRDAARGRARPLPVLYDLAGYTSAGPARVAWRGFEENVPERLARLIHEKRMGPCIVVFPDCFTALGGNQYVNSSAIGAYADYLTRELIPFVDSQFRTLASREHRGCFGKSSGGYGAMIHGMKYWRYWGGIANHSGDAYFDFVYGSAWPDTLTLLGRFTHEAATSDAPPPSGSGRRGDAAKGPRSRKSAKQERERGLAEGLDDGRVTRFLEHVWSRPRLDGHEFHALMNLCMAATYDPDPAAPNGFRLPYHLDTGELLKARWRQWLANDPVYLVGRYRRGLQHLRALYIDCGWRDQYHIHFGTRRLSRRLSEVGIEHVYEEFDGTHSGIDHRLDQSLPFLYRALQP
jgi:enterochelin esterase-like enzyme